LNNITLTWEQVDKYTESTLNYRVSKQGDVFTAWVRGKPWEIVKSRCKSADAAKAECELHYMENMK